jgi:DNA-binding response OmpR family regulator
MADRSTVLVVEDDSDIAMAVSTVLGSVGHDVIISSTGTDALRLFNDQSPDLVVLDIGLPEIDGWQVLERIRDVSEVPVIMLTARDLESDKVRGLMGGADDYLTKPFGKQELIARVHTLLRRNRGHETKDAHYADGLLEVDFVDHQVRLQGVTVDVTPTEFRLVAAFVRHPRHVLSLGQLLEAAWNDPTGIGPDRVKFAILRLRRKLGNESASASCIESVRGFGYRYLPPVP